MNRSKPPAMSHVDSGQDSGDPIWLVTLADLAGLMLVFFVMLFAMSALDQRELELSEPIATPADSRFDSGRCFDAPLRQRRQ